MTYPAGFLSGALALGSVASCPRRKRSHKGVIERVRAQTRDAIERFFEAFKRGDLDALDDLVLNDYVEEYPQSGERIRGKRLRTSRGNRRQQCFATLTAVRNGALYQPERSTIGESHPFLSYKRNTMQSGCVKGGSPWPS